MRLGNSAGKNRGKKYLKIKGTETITVENQAKADHFKYWFGTNYSKLRREIIQKDTFDEDVLNETFLRIYDKILYGGLFIQDYKAYFHRAFFTNYMQVMIDIAKGLLMSIDGHDVEDDSSDDLQMIKVKSKLEDDVLNYVYQKYPAKDYELFKIYVRLKPAINYDALSEMTSVSRNTISRTVSKIRRDLRSNQEFTERRRAIVKGYID